MHIWNSSKIFSNLGLVHQPIKLEMKIILHAFESNKQVSALPSTEPDAKIIYHAALYIQYQQTR